MCTYYTYDKVKGASEVQFVLPRPLVKYCATKGKGGSPKFLLLSQTQPPLCYATKLGHPDSYHISPLPTTFVTAHPGDHRFILLYLKLQSPICCAPTRCPQILLYPQGGQCRQSPLIGHLWISFTPSNENCKITQ
jgi:hypothetical protein